MNQQAEDEGARSWVLVKALVSFVMSLVNESALLSTYTHSRVILVKYGADHTSLCRSDLSCRRMGRMGRMGLAQPMLIRSL